MLTGFARRWRLVRRSWRHERLDFLVLWPRVQRHVPGWLFPEDARLLYALARFGPGHGAIVEIGSAWGLSTIFLGSGTKAARRERVYAVDPHTGDPWYLLDGGGGWPPPSGLSRLVAWGAPRPAYLPARPGTGFSSLDGLRANLHRFGLDQWVAPVLETSNEAARTLDTGPVRLLFIDGLHTYEGVHDDIVQWLPRVIPGGVIVFDDYHNTREGVGVRRAVDELLQSGAVVSPLRHSASRLVWTTKTSAAAAPSAPERDAVAGGPIERFAHGAVRTQVQAASSAPIRSSATIVTNKDTERGGTDMAISPAEA